MENKNENENRRKIRNQLIRPRSQLILAIPFFLMLIGAVSLTVYMFLFFSNLITQYSAIINPELMAVLLERQRDLLHVFILSLTAFGILCATFWLIISHNIFGPMVAIERHVRNLIAGHYSGVLKLRKMDEFKPLADQLNELTKILNQKK